MKELKIVFMRRGEVFKKKKILFWKCACLSADRIDEVRSTNAKAWQSTACVPQATVEENKYHFLKKWYLSSSQAKILRKLFLTNGTLAVSQCSVGNSLLLQ